jgi:DNA-directed RNA polymerase subunit M/transcription elongation factor TFIIS
MNKFCEECGNKLIAGDKFCDQCGTAVPVAEETIQEENALEQIPEAPNLVENENEKESDNITFDFFTNKKCSISLEKDTYYGIWLTNFKKLSEKFGRAETEKLKEVIGGYTDYYKKIGLNYLVLDTSDNMLKTVNGKNWKYHVNLLRKAVKRIKSKLNVDTRFVMIFGGHEIIPMPLFVNPNTTTSDKDVDTDLPYSSLSIKDPLESQEAREPMLPVGRIPTGTNTTINDLLNLLRNTQEAISKFTNERTFGLSANCWQEVSGLINSRVCKEQLFISPGLTVQNLGQYYNGQYDIHYFNLHGSNRSAEWSGQKGQEYPTAFSPVAIAQNQKLNIVGVEACYGARFIGLSKQESILLSAMSAKTVSFVGSSRIAWGPPAPPMSLADVVIHDFLAMIQQGYTAGEAFMRARVNGYLNSVERDPLTSLLTVMEFNLFGDPLFFFAGAQKQASKSFDESAKNVKFDTQGADGNLYEELSEEAMEKSSIPAPEEDSIYSRVTQAVDEAQRRITAMINKNVWERYPEFKNIEPVFKKYAFEGKTFNKLTYGKSLDKFDKYLMVNTDEQGEITSEFDSK